jgi:type IV conjugative transfer system pilin TraA
MKVATTGAASDAGSAEAWPAQKYIVSGGVSGLVKRVASFTWRNRANLLLLAAVVVCFTLPHLARAEDMLATQKQDAKDTFGHGSTVEWGLYLAEVILSIGTYIKVRNPMILIGGIPFLIVVTRAFFALAG